MSSPYKVLGVSTNASGSEINQARKKLLFNLHPDRLPKDLPEEAARLINERVLEINSAYDQIQKARSARNSINSSMKGESVNNSKSGRANKNNVINTYQGRNTEPISNNESISNKKDGSTGRLVAQIIGGLVGVSLMQMCREAGRINQPRESYPERVESITTSTVDYCPELMSSIGQQKDIGRDMPLKMLSEMRRSWPVGSVYRNRVEDLIRQLKVDDGNPNQTTKEQINTVFSKYLPLVCEGQLHLAKQKINEVDTSLSPSKTTQQGQELFANAMCKAMRDGENMDTVDERRSVGAIYMGKEIDKIPDNERALIMIEIAKNVNNKSWSNQAMVTFVKRCPDMALKFIEN